MEKVVVVDPQGNRLSQVHHWKMVVTSSSGRLVVEEFGFGRS